jgi:hypothetical protein
MAQKLANRGKCHAPVSPVRTRTWTDAADDSNETGRDSSRYPTLRRLAGAGMARSSCDAWG